MVYQGDRLCVDLTEPRRIEGVWVNYFEGSTFYEGADGTKRLPRADKPVWLTLDEQSVRPKGFKAIYGHAYRLVITGRTAKDMNRPPLEGYGHMGMSPGLMLVDEILEWQDLGLAGQLHP